MQDKEYEKLLMRDFEITQNAIWCIKRRREFSTNKELYESMIQDRDIIVFLKDYLIEDRSHLLIKDCFKEKNKLILANQFVRRLYMQNIDRAISNQFRASAKRVYDYIKSNM